MTTPKMTSAEHHAYMAACARQNAETYRAYLTWSDDPAQRRWADLLADAAERTADAEAEYAAALAAQVSA